jgi:bifunctional DNase/RNase
MELEGVRLEVPASAPVMMLREQAGRRRLLPIYIGGPEAAAIHYALEGIEPARPLTHDLLGIVIGELGATLEKVVVTAIEDHTFFAELHLVGPNGNRVVSSRPSDAVALSLRTGSPIFANEEVLDEAAQEEVVEEPVEEEEQILAEFQDFIDTVSPEDFADG